MPDADGRAIELEVGRAALLEHRVHEVNRIGIDLTAFDDGVDDLAEGGTNPADPGELDVVDADARLGMDEALLEEPHRRIRRDGQMLVALVLLVGSAVTGVERVQEVEGGLEIDAVRVLGGVQVWHVANHSIPLDRLRASDYSYAVTRDDP